MSADRTHQERRDVDWARAERFSFWAALAIALGPIPLCLLISWALGSPPWRPRPAPAHEEARDLQADFRPRPSPGDHGHP